MSCLVNDQKTREEITKVLKEEKVGRRLVPKPRYILLPKSPDALKQEIQTAVEKREEEFPIIFRGFGIDADVYFPDNISPEEATNQLYTAVQYLYKRAEELGFLKKTD